MEDKVLTEDEELERVKQEIALKKEQIANAPAVIEPQHDTDVMEVVKQEENALLKTDEFLKIAKKWGDERIKSDLSAEASRIRRKNIETAEQIFETETRELRLKHLKAEMALEHKYNMSTLDRDSKHKQMLAYKRKLVEQYSYLYNCDESNMVTVHDDKGQAYKAPKDFSYSKKVNQIRQVGRNISKLDRPILQTFKWVLIIGAGIGAFFILKSLGIL